MLRCTACCDRVRWNDAAHIDGNADGPVPNCTDRHKSATGYARSDRFAPLPEGSRPRQALVIRDLRQAHELAEDFFAEASFAEDLVC